jgi:hypothetical protein
MNGRQPHGWAILCEQVFSDFDLLPALIYNIDMAEQYTQLRIWQRTLTKLRRIYAETGERMIAIVDRLATSELARIEQAKRENVQVQAVPVEKE